MPPNTEGQWSGVQQTPGDSRAAGDARGVFVIHAVLLRSGKVLTWSGHAETVHYLPESYEWDPTDLATPAVRRAFPAGTDVFCCHHATLDDGRVVTVGGAESHHGHGIRDVCVYDPATGWSRIGAMAEARWYPTLVTLPDSRLVTFSGRTEDGAADFIAKSVEVLSPPFAGPGYATATVAGGDKTFPTYPGLHLVPGGRIVHTGTTWRYESTVTSPIGTWSFRMTGPATGTWTDHGVFPNVRFREEGTSVLLPPAQDGRVLLVGGAKTNTSGGAFVSHEPGSDLRAAEILDTTTNTWHRIADMTHPRINVSAVLLPDGKLLVLGGHDRYKWDATSAPSNQAEIYDPVLDSWTPVATMGESRTYHSAALLLPDGRVFVAGGVDPTRSEPDVGGTLNQKTFELYSPPYFFNGARPVITGVSRPDGPDDTVTYGGELLVDVQTPGGAPVVRASLMRPGAMTHHTDTEQRLVALDVAPAGAGRIRVRVPDDPSVAPPGWYMLWVVDSAGLPCERARFVHLTRRRCFVVTDRSHISRDEIADAAAPPTELPQAFYVVLDGFLPSEAGVTTATPTPAQLQAIAPTVAFRRADGTAAPGMSATCTDLLVEDPALPAGVRQRFAFRYSILVAGTGVFFEADGVTQIETQQVTIAATAGYFTCANEITLTHQPNPFMLDGDPAWLSVDLRVFQLSAGDPPLFGHSVGNDGAAAAAFIRAVLTDFNASPAAARTQFESIDTDQQGSRLELARMRGGRRVFNFAIAQVRYRGRTLSAQDVRVFFRMFTTAATGLDFRQPTTYRRENNPQGEPIPVLGLLGGEIATIPFFAEQRVNTALQSMTDQRDVTNARTVAPVGAGGGETTAYFGCWLDFNQTENRYPLNPSGFGPYSSGLKSIQELIRGRHQCLVAEVHFANDPIPEGATPGGNDNLSQRNLAIVESDNPGSVASRTVAHTFEVKPSPDYATAIAQTATAGRDLKAVVATRARRGRRDEKAPDVAFPWAGEDELMIQWRTLPRDSVVTLYLPGVGADTILDLAARRTGTHRLERVDDDTVRCLVGEVTFVPLPAGRTSAIPGLLTIELPEGVKKGQVYEIVVSQFGGPRRRVLGSFQVTIPIGTAADLLPDAEHTLAVLRHIDLAIPAGDRWKPVFGRYVDQAGAHVRGLGGDPSAVDPSPDGTGGRRKPDHQGGDRDEWAELCHLAHCVLRAAGRFAAEVVRCVCEECRKR